VELPAGQGAPPALASLRARDPALLPRHLAAPAEACARWERELKLRDLAGPARRAGWGLADQALSSLSNLAVGVLVARSSTVAEFGVYALAFGGYTIALNVSRAVATEPLAVRHSGERSGGWQQAVRASTATAVLVGLVGLLVGLAIAVVPGVPARGVLIAFAVTMPGLLLQDAWRWAFFVVGDGRQAFLNDLVWLLAMGVIFAGLYLTDTQSVTTLTLAWGLAATIAAVVGRFQAGVMPNVRLVVGWLKTHRDLTPKYVGEMLAVSGTIQLYMVGITAVAGIAAVSGIRGAQILLGPVNVLNQGIRVIAVPEAARALKHSHRRLWLTGLLISFGVGVGAFAWGAIFLLLPDSVGTSLLGKGVWAEASGVLVPVILLQALGASNAGAFAILRALAAAGRGLRVRLISSVVLTLAGVGGGYAWGARGAAWGLASAAALTLTLWWWEARRALLAHHSTQPTQAGKRIAETR
jgi:O-antigen/teichoic acid export membrane protein